MAKYGAQQYTECSSINEDWCNSDSGKYPLVCSDSYAKLPQGNGVTPDGSTFITGNDPHDTSKTADTSYAIAMISMFSLSFNSMISDQSAQIK